MLYAVVFLSDLAITYYIGSRARKNQPFRKTASTMVLVFVVIMVFLIGLRMGVNKDIINGLATIGLLALGLSIIVWIVTSIGISLVCRILDISRFGEEMQHNADTGKSTDDPSCKSSSEHAFTLIVIVSTAAGLLIAYFLLLPAISDQDILMLEKIANKGIMTILTLMVACIGYEMGIEGKILGELRKAGLRIMAVPVAIGIFTLLSGIICGLIFPQITITESLSICFGYGWYTLAPGIITAAGHEIAGAISFIHNVIREFGGLILIPFVARKIGHMEAAGMPGIAIMDVCLPVLLKSTRNEMVAYAFAIGITEEIFTTILVPLFIGA